MPDILLRNVPPELHRAIRIGAALQGQTMSEFVLAQLEKSYAVRKAAGLAHVAPNQREEGES